jgi:hypothetical protein
MSSGKEGVLKIRDSAGYDWEEVTCPSPPPPPSSENAHLIPPEPTSEPQQLCGYLTKASKGPLRTWRSRWFVFEDQRCRLYYYNSRNDFTPQGYINISNALFSYSVEDSPKFQFDIRADGRVHSLQASSKEAMSYWLNQLQSRRRTFSRRRKKNSCTDKVAEVTFVDGTTCTSVGGASAAGSAGDKGTEEEKEETNGGPNASAPLELQEGPPQVTLPSRSRLSFKQHITGLFRPSQTGHQTGQTGSQPGTGGDPPNSQRRSNFFVEPAIREPAIRENSEAGRSESDLVSSTEPASSAAGPSSDPPRASHISLSRKLLNKVTRHSQVPSGTDQGDCLQCQICKAKVEELEVELSRREQEVRDRDEINEFLRNEIRTADMKNKVKEELMTSSGSAEDEKKVDILLQRDQIIAQCHKLLEEAKIEKEQLTTEIEAKRREVQALAEQVDLYTEAVTAKDHVVVELTNQPW